MLDLLLIYWPSIIASTVLGGGLALLGAQLAARDRAMQTLCVSQGAMLGVLVGIGLSQIFGATVLGESSLPFACAFLAAAVTYLASERFVSKRSSSSNTHFAALFTFLLAGGYLVSALFPALENHMAQKYFGDLATMSEQSALFALLLGSALLGLLLLFQRVITRDSFAMLILGAKLTPTGRLFAIGALITLCLSVQIVGFLFTVACLFIPTSVLSFGRNISLKRHLATCLGTAALACCIGFVGTLWLTRLPTVPAIITVMATTALIANVIGLISSNRPRHG